MIFAAGAISGSISNSEKPMTAPSGVRISWDILAKNALFAKLAEFAASHPFCQACGADWRPLHIHHIIGGRGGRSDEAENLLRLCHRPCHDLAEGLDVVTSPSASSALERDHYLLPKLTLAIQLSMKDRMGELVEGRLTALHGRTLPEPAPIPLWFRDAFYRHRPELRPQSENA